MPCIRCPVYNITLKPKHVLHSIFALNSCALYMQLGCLKCRHWAKGLQAVRVSSKCTDQEALSPVDCVSDCPLLAGAVV